MELTYPFRKMYINEERRRVKDVMWEYPCLFDKEEVVSGITYCYYTNHHYNHCNSIINPGTYFKFYILPRKIPLKIYGFFPLSKKTLLLALLFLTKYLETKAYFVCP